MSTASNGVSPEDLRDSVRDFRDSRTSSRDRDYIQSWWESLNIPNQFAAMLRAAEIERTPEEQT